MDSAVDTGELTTAMSLTASGYTPRVQQLREQVLQARPTICPERARFYTQVYREHPEMPVVARRALALERTLAGMSIFIEDGALIVGNQSSTLRAAPIFPEYAVEWIEKEIDQFEERSGDVFYPSQEVKQELLEICDFWRGQTILDKGRFLMSPLAHRIHDAGRLVPDYDTAPCAQLFGGYE